MKKSYLIGLVILAVLVIGVYFLFFRNPKAPTELIKVVRGSITEIVSITGNTTPTQSVSLGFQDSGTISHIYRNLGDMVNAGEIVADLDMADLSAALQQAQANVSVSQAGLQKAQQDLANLYSGISDSATSGYAKSNDAVRVQLDTFFSNAETNQPQLNFQTSNPQSATDAVSLRISATIELNAWRNELLGINPMLSSEALIVILRNDLSHLAVVQNLLNTASVVLAGNINLSATQLATDKANVTTGLNEVNAAISSLNTISQNIASQKAIVAQVQAQVQQALAGVASAQAKLQGAQIVAPISGVVTQQDAKVGQLATPGTALVSIIGNKGFEVDSGASEIDVGKLSVGNTAIMTLDAFPNETFSGHVFYIAPSQTNNQGVITYQTKISFDKWDSRIKSGLTANIKIQTRYKDSALILPQYAILQNDQGTFVEIMENNTVKQIPVTIGLQDEKGNVEIISGVSEDEQVLNIGLKTQ